METANTACLLLLDLPNAALGGIDLLSFSTTPRFRGVRDLPPGFHFTFAATSAAFDERHGLWFFVPRLMTSIPRSLTIANWNSTSESLESVDDPAQQLRWRANLGELWLTRLTPYRQSAPKDAADSADEEVGDWATLTSAMTAELLTRITGGDANHWHLRSTSSAKRDVEDLPGLDDAGRKFLLGAVDELHFLPIDLKNTWPEGATGSERTEAARDYSYALHKLVENHANGNMNEIIGELQFSFLMILTISNPSCLEQWKRLVKLIFKCNTAIASYSDFFINALSCVRLQLQHIKDAESALFDVKNEDESVLKGLLTSFRLALDSHDPLNFEVSSVRDELDDLEAYLREELGWQFRGKFVREGVLELEDGEKITMDTIDYDEEDETGEFAPVVVDVTDEQAMFLGRDVGNEVSELHKKASRMSLKEAVENESDDDEEEMQDLEEMDERY